MSTDSKLIRILTVDDHPLLREGIAALVRAEVDMSVVAEADDGAEAIEKFRLHRPDVTLMDVEMPSVNGIEAISKIRSEFPDARIIVLTTYSGDATVVRALKAGARAYILKDTSIENSWGPFAQSMPDRNAYLQRSPQNLPSTLRMTS